MICSLRSEFSFTLLALEQPPPGRSSRPDRDTDSMARVEFWHQYARGRARHGVLLC
jgi:hypothetical protein